MEPLNYDWSKTRAASSARGLYFRDNVMLAADDACHVAGLTQDQVDSMGQSWCEFAAIQFNRTNYSFAKRLKLVAYWLGLVPNHIK